MVKSRAEKRIARAERRMKHAFHVSKALEATEFGSAAEKHAFRNLGQKMSKWRTLQHEEKMKGFKKYSAEAKAGRARQRAREASRVAKIKAKKEAWAMGARRSKTLDRIVYNKAFRKYYKDLKAATSASGGGGSSGGGSSSK